MTKRNHIMARRVRLLLLALTTMIVQSLLTDGVNGRGYSNSPPHRSTRNHEELEQVSVASVPLRVVNNTDDFGEDRLVASDHRKLATIFDTDGGGWTLVRRTVGPTWHTYNDNLAGNIYYGSPSTNPTGPSTFSTAFSSDFNEFMFATGDGSKWLIARKSDVIGVYTNSQRAVQKSSISTNDAYLARWQNRGTSNSEDPWISLTDHYLASSNYGEGMLYGENSTPYNTLNLVYNQGANVFIRKQTTKDTTPRGCQGPFVYRGHAVGVYDYSYARATMTNVQCTNIRSVTVTVNVLHTRAGDLAISLLHPSGARVYLMVYNGGDGVSFTNTVLSDSAATSIGGVTAASAPFTGSYRPYYALYALNGLSAVGDWSLELYDGYSSNNGVLKSWTLNFECRSCPVCPSGTYDNTGVCTACPTGCTACSLVGAVVTCSSCSTGKYRVGALCSGSCDPTCTTCDGPSANNCLTCTSPKTWVPSAKTCVDATDVLSYFTMTNAVGGQDSVTVRGTFPATIATSSSLATGNTETNTLKSVTMGLYKDGETALSSCGTVTCTYGSSGAVLGPCTVGGSRIESSSVTSGNTVSFTILLKNLEYCLLRSISGSTVNYDGALKATVQRIKPSTFFGGSSQTTEVDTVLDVHYNTQQSAVGSGSMRAFGQESVNYKYKLTEDYTNARVAAKFTFEFPYPYSFDETLVAAAIPTITAGVGTTGASTGPMIRTGSCADEWGGSNVLTNENTLCTVDYTIYLATTTQSSASTCVGTNGVNYLFTATPVCDPFAADDTLTACAVQLTTATTFSVYVPPLCSSSGSSSAISAELVFAQSSNGASTFTPATRFIPEDTVYVGLCAHGNNVNFAAYKINDVKVLASNNEAGAVALDAGSFVYVSSGSPSNAYLVGSSGPLKNSAGIALTCEGYAVISFPVSLFNTKGGVSAARKKGSSDAYIWVYLLEANTRRLYTHTVRALVTTEGSGTLTTATASGTITIDQSTSSTADAVSLDTTSSDTSGSNCDNDENTIAYANLALKIGTMFAAVGIAVALRRSKSLGLLNVK